MYADTDGWNHTLPRRTIVVKPSGNSLTPRPSSPQEKGDVTIVPIEIEAKAEEDFPTMEFKETKKEVEELCDVLEKEDGLSQCLISTVCKKRAPEKDIRLHVRDDRDFHMILMVQHLLKQRLRWETLYDRHMEVYKNTFPDIARAENVIHKFGHVPHIFRFGDFENEVKKGLVCKERPHVLTSDPFESHRFGYKMILMVYPCGVKLKEKAFLSLFVSLLPSEFDPILAWPFACPVTFTLRSGASGKDLSRTYIPDGDNESMFSKPMPNQRNSSFGFQNFLALQHLQEFVDTGDLFIDVFLDVEQLRDSEMKSIGR